MKLVVIGAGYVGLVTGACFAEMGNTVACVDTDARRTEGLLAGHMPIYEPGLEQLVAANLGAGRLSFTTSLADAMADGFFCFIAVGTPPTAGGSVDMSHVFGVAREIGRLITRETVVVHKSTVPVGTADKVKAIISEELALRGISVPFHVVSNPEFLKEGDAVNDFMRPERIIIGAESAWAIEQIRSLYAPFTRSHDRFMIMGVRDAEMTKYAANAMLATRISYMNELANLCEHLGVDVENVRQGMGSDSRIGHSFLYPGCGYGGSCFPKDVQALIFAASECGYSLDILRAVEARNRAQKQRLFEKICIKFGPKLDVRLFGIWGLSFKPGTDDLRESPAIDLIDQLVTAGARIRVYDPVAMDNAKRTLPPDWFESGTVELTDHQYDAARGADALVLVTEWKPFRHPDFEELRRIMRLPIIFDGRNQYDPKHVRSLGFEYFGIGR